jgi:hypothetical protein
MNKLLSVPHLSDEQERAVSALDALRLYALVELLIDKGVFTRDEYKDAVEKAADHDWEKVLNLLSFVPVTKPNP